MSRIERVIKFVTLYIYAVWVSMRKGKKETPLGIRGEAVFMFLDPAFPARRHGVVAFVLQPTVEVERFSPNLWGPFGFSSDIDLGGLHLYGRDTWGTVNQDQIQANPVLADLAHQNRGCVILLAGVRSVFGHHISPLNDAGKYKLVWK